MWMGFLFGWILGSVSLYAYIYLTAKEAQNDECVECHLPECTECPHAVSTDIAYRRAA